jgi:hypothetical protein
MSSKKYTHRDAGGMLWRFQGSRPISALADEVMARVLADEAMVSKVKKRPLKKRTIKKT